MLGVIRLCECVVGVFVQLRDNVSTDALPIFGVVHKVDHLIRKPGDAFFDLIEYAGE